MYIDLVPKHGLWYVSNSLYSSKQSGSLDPWDTSMKAKMSSGLTISEMNDSVNDCSFHTATIFQIEVRGPWQCLWSTQGERIVIESLVVLGFQCDLCWFITLTTTRYGTTWLTCSHKSWLRSAVREWQWYDALRFPFLCSTALGRSQICFWY